MKKSLGFMAVVFILIGAGFFYCFSMIAGQKAQVQISHSTLAGDMAAAKGITLQFRNQWTGRLFWDTEITIDEAMIAAAGGKEYHPVASKTAFREDWSFDGKYQSRIWFDQGVEPVELYYTNGGLHWSLSKGVHPEEFAEYTDIEFKEAFADVATRTEAGHSRTEEVRLADYEEFYPISINAITYMDGDNGGGYSFSAQELLGVRIPDDHRMAITVGLDKQGNIIEVSTGEQVGAVSFESCSLYTDEGTYFAFYEIDELGRALVPDSKIGHGIYKVSVERIYDKENLEKWNGEFTYDITKVYTLPEEDCYPIDMKADGDGNMLLFTQEAGKLLLRVIEPDNMREMEQLELMDYPESGRYRHTDVTEDYLFTVMYNGDFCYLTKEEGEYKLQIKSSLGSDQSFGGSYKWDYALDYQKGKLALICGVDNFSSSVMVYVFGTEGLEYKGHFRNSADTEQMPYLDKRISLTVEEGLEIWFTDEKK